MSVGTLDGRARARGPADILSVPVIIGLVLVGLFAFASLVLLMSYSDELRPDDAATATANDRSAVGYSGLQDLLRELDVEVRVDPYPHRGGWNGRDIRLYFPTGAFSDGRRERIDPDAPGLFILPKWSVSPVEQDSAFVIRRSNPGLSYQSGRILETLQSGLQVNVQDAVQVDWRLDLPGNTPTISYPRWIVDAPETRHAEANEPDGEDDAEPGTSDAPEDTASDADEDAEATEEQSRLERDLEEMMEAFRVSRTMTLVDTDAPGDLNALLRPVDDLNVLVLAEPDLLANHGIATQPRARLAVGLLAEVAREFGVTDPVFVFDDSLRRRDTSQNLVKLLTRPPFLAATLCLLAAGALIGWQGFNRFGDAVREGENAPDAARNGPQALAESAAEFIRGAGRIDALAPRYADVVRRQAVDALSLPRWDRARADAALTRRESLRSVSPTLAQIRADQTLTPMARVTALRRWKEEMTR